MKRREFIQTAAFASVTLAALPSLLYAGKQKKQIGLQLYTLRDTIATNPKPDLEKVASFGYKKIETYGYNNGSIFGMPFKEFNQFTSSLGLEITSGHYPYEMLNTDGWKRALEDAQSARQEYVVIPWLNEDVRKSIDQYKRVCESMNKAGEQAKAHKLRLGYHNHAFEFETLEGHIPYDVMLKELDKNCVSMELDLFWVVNAGKNPLDYFTKYPGRFEQWHVKDMNKDDRNKNADVGSGTIDWGEIFAARKKAGLKNFYVEQESYPGSPIDSVRESINFLRTIL